MVIALTAVALLGLMASATMTVAGVLSNESQRRSQADVVSYFVQATETIATNPIACKGTGSGANRIEGLKFRPSGSQASQVCSSSCLNLGSGTGKLPVTLGTNLSCSGREIRAAVECADENIRVNDLYLTNVQVSGTTASGTLMASLSTISPELGFAPRVVGQVNMTFDAGGNLLACNSSPSAQKMCEDMECTYNANATGQKCTCGFPTLDCRGPGGGGPSSYIDGYDPASGLPKCRQVRISCSDTHGPGYFFAGIDNSGRPVCLAVEGGYGVPPVAPAPAPAPAPVAPAPAPGAPAPGAPAPGAPAPGAPATVPWTYLSQTSGQDPPGQCYGCPNPTDDCTVYKFDGNDFLTTQPPCNLANNGKFMNYYRCQSSGNTTWLDVEYQCSYP